MVKDAFSSIRADLARIAKAHAARDPWAVLGIPSGSDYRQIKATHRKWIRKLHPDRWFATADSELYREIHEAFYEIQVAYFEALKHCASVHAPAEDPITISTPAAKETRARWPRSWLRSLFDKKNRVRRVFTYFSSNASG